MRTVAALVIALASLLVGKETNAQTLGEMTHKCEMLETAWRLRPPQSGTFFIPPDPDAASCFGYISAFFGLRQLVQPPAGDEKIDCSKGIGSLNCKSTLNMCIPAGVDYDQILAVFLSYARSHTAQWHETAWSHYLTSMMTAFPCKGNHVTPKE